jgi:hypothetical protein
MNDLYVAKGLKIFFVLETEVFCVNYFDFFDVVG